MEDWKPVSVDAFGDFATHYEVSSEGNVRRNGRLLKPLSVTSGYKAVNLSYKGKTRTKTIHQLVYYSFNGGKPSGLKMVIDHVDDNKANNRLSNLRLVTTYENIVKGRRFDLPERVSIMNNYNGKQGYAYVVNGKHLKKSQNIEVVLAFKEGYEWKH